MFMLESGMIGLIGGIIGIVLGYALGEGFLILRSYAISRTEAFSNIETVSVTHVSLSWELILISILLSFFVGIVAGIFPARKASKLPPVEALRYE